MSRRTRALLSVGAVLAAAAAATPLPVATADGAHRYDDLTHIAPLDSPRGVDAIGHGMTMVTEGDGSFSLVVERKHRPARVVELGTLGGEFAPAIAVGRHRTVWLLTGGGPPPEEEQPAMPRSFGQVEEPAAPRPATLYKWRPHWKAPVPVADIGAYQASDPDPFNQSDPPTTTNPFGLAALWKGGVLVADAEGNDLLRVRPDGHIHTVARLKPRLVEVPAGLPDVPPEQGGPPPVGTPILAEAVATSVAVKHGYAYIGELRGFPATPGTSQIWRVPTGAKNAVCDPEKPHSGPCRRYADGLTSIIDLAPARHGILALELSKMGWLHWEFGVEGAEIGGLFHVTRHRRHELVPGQLVTPGGVDSSYDGIYVTGPIFGPGHLMRID